MKALVSPEIFSIKQHKVIKNELKIIRQIKILLFNFKEIKRSCNMLYVKNDNLNKYILLHVQLKANGNDRSRKIKSVVFWEFLSNDHRHFHYLGNTEWIKTMYCKFLLLNNLLNSSDIAYVYHR